MDSQIPYEILEGEGVLSLIDRLKINRYLRIKAFKEKIVAVSQEITRDDFLYFMSITDENDYCIIISLEYDEPLNSKESQLIFQFQNKSDLEILESVQYHVDYDDDGVISSNVSRWICNDEKDYASTLIRDPFKGVPFANEIYSPLMSHDYHGFEYVTTFELDFFSCFKIWLNKFLLGAISENEDKIALKLAKDAAIDYLGKTLDDLALYESAYLQYSYLYLTCKMMRIDVVFFPHPKMVQNDDSLWIRNVDIDDDNLYGVEYGEGMTRHDLDEIEFEAEIEWRQSLEDIYQPKIVNLYNLVVDFIKTYKI